MFHRKVTWIVLPSSGRPLTNADVVVEARTVLSYRLLSPRLTPTSNCQSSTVAPLSLQAKLTSPAGSVEPGDGEDNAGVPGVPPFDVYT